jgi:hypothetical protein
MYWPEYFAAIIAIAGAADTLHADMGLSVPVWVAHSREDGVVPFKASEEIVNKRIQLGDTPRTNFFDGWGHFSLYPSMVDPEVVTWLFAQERQIATESTRGACPPPQNSPGSATAPRVFLSNRGVRATTANGVVFDLRGRMQSPLLILPKPLQ